LSVDYSFPWANLIVNAVSRRNSIRGKVALICEFRLKAFSEAAALIEQNFPYLIHPIAEGFKLQENYRVSKNQLGTNEAGGMHPGH
jgi:hypothetical protein